MVTLRSSSSAWDQTVLSDQQMSVWSYCIDSLAALFWSSVSHLAPTSDLRSRSSYHSRNHLLTATPWCPLHLDLCARLATMAQYSSALLPLCQWRLFHRPVVSWYMSPGQSWYENHFWREVRRSSSKLVDSRALSSGATEHSLLCPSLLLVYRSPVSLAPSTFAGLSSSHRALTRSASPPCSLFKSQGWMEPFVKLLFHQMWFGWIFETVQ